MDDDLLAGIPEYAPEPGQCSHPFLHPLFYASLPDGMKLWCVCCGEFVGRPVTHHG